MSGREKAQLPCAANSPPENCACIGYFGPRTRRSHKPRRQRHHLSSSAPPATRSCLTLHQCCSRMRTGRVYFHNLNSISGGAVRLLADSEFADDLAIPVCIALLQVVQQTATLAHKHQKPAARTVILLMLFEVFRQFANTLAQNRDLYLWTP